MEGKGVTDREWVGTSEEEKKVGPTQNYDLKNNRTITTIRITEEEMAE